MINLIIFFIIFIIIIYIIFHLFVIFSKSFNLIDEKFNNIVSNIKDTHIKKLFIEKDKKLNKYIRYDFLISLFLGIIWFLFPILVINLKTQEKIKFFKKEKFVGKYLGLFTLVTGVITLSYLKKDTKEKIKILYTKVFCASIVILSLFLNIYYLKRIEITNIITLFLTTIWLFNSIIGILEYHNIIIL